MDYQSFKHQLLKGALKNIYLFSGAEAGDKKEAFSILKQRLFGKEEPTVYTFYCDSEFVPSDFLNAVQTGGLFSATRLILLKGIEQAKDSVIKTLTSLLLPTAIESAGYELVFSRFPREAKQLAAYYEKKEDRYFLKKIKEADKKKIAELFSICGFSPLDRETIIVASDETNEKIPEAVTRLFPENQTVQFFEMFENQKPEWIRSEFAKHKLLIEPNAITFLLDMIENNKSALEQEIRNIIISYQQNFDKTKASPPTVTRDFIEEYLYHSKEETPFSLFAAMICRNREKSLDILDKLYQSDPSGILPGLLWSQRRAVRILDLYENMKQPREVIFRELFIKGKKVQQELSALFGQFSFHHAVHALNRLSLLEYHLRLLPPSIGIVQLQMFILDYLDGRIDRDFLQGDILFVVT